MKFLKCFALLDILASSKPNEHPTKSAPPQSSMSQVSTDRHIPARLFDAFLLGLIGDCVCHELF